MGARIRAAVPGDGARIVDVQTVAWQTAYKGILPEDRLAALSDPVRQERSAAMWDRRADGQVNGAALLVAEVDGALSGFAATSEPDEPDLDDTVCELAVFHLHPQQWGTGLAAQLLAATQDYMRRAGFRTGALWTVQDAGRARRFYEREGWEHDGHTRTELDKPLWRDVYIPQVRYLTRLA